MFVVKKMQTLIRSIRNIFVSVGALAVLATPAFAQGSSDAATPSPAVTSGFDKSTALVIFVVVALVIVAAWWYTKEEDEEETQMASRPKKATGRSRRK